MVNTSQILLLRHARGMTLVEVMITVVLLALLVLIGSTLGADWMHRVHIQEAHQNFEQAWSQAKMLALRNPSCASAYDEETAASTLIIRPPVNSRYQLEVFAGDADEADEADEADCKGQSAGEANAWMVWRTELPQGVVLDPPNSLSWKFNNRGLLIGDSAAGKVTIGKGGSQYAEEFQWP